MSTQGPGQGDHRVRHVLSLRVHPFEEEVLTVLPGGTNLALGPECRRQSTLGSDWQLGQGNPFAVHGPVQKLHNERAKLCGLAAHLVVIFRIHLVTKLRMMIVLTGALLKCFPVTTAVAQTAPAAFEVMVRSTATSREEGCRE